MFVTKCELQKIFFIKILLQWVEQLQCSSAREYGMKEMIFQLTFENGKRMFNVLM